MARRTAKPKIKKSVEAITHEEVHRKNIPTEEYQSVLSKDAKADFEYLYDKPYEDKKKVRVVGPFTVESLSPHRVLGVDENDELIDSMAKPGSDYDDAHDFVTMILENLKTAGVQQAHKEDKVDFTSLTPWPGDLICAEERYEENSEW